MELFWHQAPLVRILLPFALGISLRLFTPFSGPGFECLILTALLFLSVLLIDSLWRIRRRNHFFGLLSFFLFVLLGVLIADSESCYRDRPIPEAQMYRALVEGSPVPKRKTFAVPLKLLSIQNADTVFPSSGEKIMAYIDKEGFHSGIVPGAMIRFQADIRVPEPPRHPLQFDYGGFLKTNGFSATSYIPANTYEIEKGRKFSLSAFANSIRHRVLCRIEDHAGDGDEYGIIAALILGQRSFIDPEIRNQFADAGAVHILAVSGLHVGIIYLLLITLLKLLFGKRHRFLNLALVLMTLWAYALITGLSASVLRAATMFSFIALGKYWGRFGNIYNMIAASALILLIFDPFLLAQPGFQLSYLAVIGIVFYFPHFHSLLFIENKWLDKVWSLICVSLAAQLATFPLSLYYFHQFPNFFLLTNLLVIPLATLILYSGILWISVIWWNAAAEIIANITLGACRLLNSIIAWIAELPGSTASDVFLTGLEVALMYTVMVLMTVFLIHPGRFTVRLAGFSIVILALCLQGRRWSNSIQSVCYFPNQGDNPSLVFIREGRAIVAAKDTSKIKPIINRDLKPYLLYRGISEKSVEILPLSDLSGQTTLPIVVDTARSEQDVHLAWNTVESESVFLSTNGLQAEELTLHKDPGFKIIETRELSRFSSDLLPRKKLRSH